ncbi:hypothetical protein PO909_025100 [Leuciscus waleckii]
MRAISSEGKRLTPRYTVPAALRCPQGTIMLTPPPCVFRGAAVSGEHISQGPPGNVVVLGCPPPPRRVPEQSVRSFPAGSPYRDDGLTVQQLNPEAGLERLVPLLEFLTAWKMLPNISCWVLQTIEKGYHRVSPAQVYGGPIHRGGPQAGSGNGTRSENPVGERGHRTCTSLQ